MAEEIGRVTFTQVLKNRPFFSLWLAQFVSNFGDWLALLGLFSLITFKKHGTPYEVSGIMIAYVIPVAFVGPLAGVLVDRWNLKRTMVASDLIRSGIAAVLLLPGETYQFYPLISLLSVVSCFFLPAQAVAIPLLVRREELLVANSLNAQTIQVNRVISPAVAGLLVAWLGERACFAIDSLSFLFSAAMIMTIAFGARPERAESRRKSMLSELHEGLKFIGGHRALLFVIVSIVAAILAVGAFDALMPIYVRDVLSARGQVFGAIISLAGVGTLVGSLAIGRFGQGHSKVFMVAGGILGIGINIVALTELNSVSTVLVCALFFGAAVAYVLVPSQTLVQEETPHELLGRVSSTSMSLMTFAQLASFVASGTIAAWIGILNLYLLVGLTLILIGLLGVGYARVYGSKQPMPASADPGEQV